MNACRLAHQTVVKVSKWRQSWHTERCYTIQTRKKDFALYVMTRVVTPFWVNTYGTECMNGMFVCGGTENEFPTLWKIVNIFLMIRHFLWPQNVIMGFDGYLHAFRIEKDFFILIGVTALFSSFLILFDLYFHVGINTPSMHRYTTLLKLKGHGVVVWGWGLPDRLHTELVTSQSQGMCVSHH